MLKEWEIDPIQHAISKYNTNEKTVTQGCLKDTASIHWFVANSKTVRNKQLTGLWNYSSFLGTNGHIEILVWKLPCFLLSCFRHLTHDWCSNSSYWISPPTALAPRWDPIHQDANFSLISILTCFQVFCLAYYQAIFATNFLVQQKQQEVIGTSQAMIPIQQMLSNPVYQKLKHPSQWWGNTDKSNSLAIFRESMQHLWNTPTVVQSLWKRYLTMWKRKMSFQIYLWKKR
jgi:hypothetical protein